jgi:hypothetical protein
MCSRSAEDQPGDAVGVGSGGHGACHALTLAQAYDSAPAQGARPVDGNQEAVAVAASIPAQTDPTPRFPSAREVTVPVMPGPSHTGTTVGLT